MSLFLNLDESKFKSYYIDDIFIDKSMLLKACNNNLYKESSKYMCITRPRRFGKTLALSMLNAYYSRGCDSKELFDKLNISKESTYEEHLNKHNVIWIDMASLYTDIDDKKEFVSELKSQIIDDLKKCILIF